MKHRPSKIREVLKTPRIQKASIFLAFVSLIGLLIWWFVFHPYVTTDDARVAMTLVRVAPYNVSGRIEKVNVDVGYTVKANEVLVEIDHRIPQANYDRAKTKSDLTNRELERIERLAKAGSVSQQTLDQSRANAAIAEAELNLAQVALENTYLKSPFDGIVVQKLANEGALLEPNQTAVVVADEKNAWIAANIEETSIGTVKVGQPVSIHIDEGGEIEGKVEEINSSVASQFALIPSDSGAGNYTKVVQRIPIKVSIIGDHKRPLRAGQSVEIKIKVH